MPRPAKYLRAIALDSLAVVLLVTFFLLTWGQVRLFLPSGISEVLLLSLAGVIATIFALIPPIAALIISVSTDPLDRQRMLRRYRDNAFEFVAVYSLGTVLWVVLVALLLPKSGAGSISAPTEWLIAVLIVLLIGVIWLIVYVYRLISAPTEDRVKWLELEMEEAIERALISVVAWHLLQKRVDPKPEPRVRVVYDVTMTQGMANDFYCPPVLKHGEYLKDVSLHRVDRWLTKCGLSTNGAARIATVLDRRFHPGHALAAVRMNSADGPSQVDVSSLSTACEFVRSNPAGQLESSLRYLRDRAWKAAHDGATGEFESILEIFTRLAVCLYTVEQRRPPGIPPKQLPYLLPATLLRAAAHELGEEVFQVSSPNTVKAWVHFPQRLLQATRDFDDRRVWVLTYPWWQAVQLIRRWGSDPTLTAHRKLLLQSLEMRLHYYVAELSATKQQAGTDVQKRNIEEEASLLLRVLGRLCSVLNTCELPKFAQLLRSELPKITELLRVDDGDDRGLQLGRTPWLLCARYMLADSATFGDNVSDAASSMRENWKQVTSVYSKLRDLIDDYVTLRTGKIERIEHRAYRIYEQSVHLTWEEQWRVGLGLTPPVIQGDPERDLKAVVVMLALDRDSNDELLILPEGSRDTLCELLSELSPMEVENPAAKFFSNVAPRREELPRLMALTLSMMQQRAYCSDSPA